MRPIDDFSRLVAEEIDAELRALQHPRPDPLRWLLLKDAGALESALAATRIRFPQGAEVVVELTGAWESVRSLISVYVIAHGDRSSDPDKDWNEAWDLSEAFDQHKKAYLDAAQKAAGVKL